MKIRNGFVSNSSSSSFVILGVELTKEEKDVLLSNKDDSLYEISEEMGLDYTPDADFEVVGKFLSIVSNDDGYTEGKSISMEELYNLRKEIATKLHVSGERIKLYIGTMSS